MSQKALELCAQSLGQIAVEDTVRGLLVQQGAMAACCVLATDETVALQTRCSASHAIAKICVTLNPNLLPPHLRYEF